MWVGIFRALFLALGLWYALASATGELFVNIGNTQADAGDYPAAFVSYLKASGAFPLSNPIREREGTINGIANAIPPDVVLVVLDRVIDNDPNNPLLYWYAAIQALRMQDLPRAAAYMERLKNIGPDWPETKNVEDVYAAVAAMVEK